MSPKETAVSRLYQPRKCFILARGYFAVIVERPRETHLNKTIRKPNLITGFSFIYFFIPICCRLEN